MQDFDKAIGLNPLDAQVFNFRGAIYGDLGQLELAIQDYNEAIGLNSQYAAAYANRGVAYVILGKDALAQQDIESAVKLGVDRADLEAAIEYAKKNQ